MELTATKKIKIEIEDNNTCGYGCFVDTKGICKLYDEFVCYPDQDWSQLKRLQKCKDDFGVIEEV